jgi:hypothetical protein
MDRIFLNCSRNNQILSSFIQSRGVLKKVDIYRLSFTYSSSVLLDPSLQEESLSEWEES